MKKKKNLKYFNPFVLPKYSPINPIVPPRNFMN